jgi:predicted exporter
MKPGRRALALWLLALSVCAAIVARTDFTADMSAFLPSHPSAEQRFLIDQLTRGALSRTLLIGIEGGSAPERARWSKALAARMNESGLFAAVQNGEAGALARDRELLFAYRYLLSPAVTPQRFSVEGLRAAVGDTIDLVASPVGLMVKGLLARDPTGETLALLAALQEGAGSPAMRDGVWASRDGQRALLMAQTRADGSDTDAQQAALARVRAEFRQLAGDVPDARVLMSGSPVFSVDARERIRSEVRRVSVLGLAAVAGLLLVVYRSAAALALGLLPVLSGALAGIAAVSLGFGTVHGITVGFGTTLIGEAVDYSIYYFVQSHAGGGAGWMERFWPTIRLGVLTSVCGFAALLFSGFPGLAQLGLYSIAGLAAAAAVTRHVLPALRPAALSVRDIAPLGARLARVAQALARARWLAAALVLGAIAVLAAQRGEIWNMGLSGLSPVPAGLQATDAQLRGDLAAPDLRYLIAVSAPEREAALEAAERFGPALQALAGSGAIAGFETPARFLPSAATQRARLAAIPAADELRARLQEALAELPLRPDKLSGFVADTQAARGLPPLTPARLAGTSLGLGVDALLLPSAGGWSAVIALRAPASGAIDVAAVQRAAAAEPAALFIDLLEASNAMYADYLGEALRLSLAGVAAIVLLLALALRSALRLARVLAPLAAAVLLVVAGLALAGVKLTLLHLVGLLLIVAVGSNYALFFDRIGDAPEARTLASLALAALTTVIGFGVLALADVPVLRAIGATVAPGAVLALLLAALLAGRRASAT